MKSDREMAPPKTEKKEEGQEEKVREGREERARMRWW